MRADFPSGEVSCLRLSAYGCPASVNCPCVGAGKICTPQASTHCRKEPTHISASTIVLRATMR